MVSAVLRQFMFDSSEILEDVTVLEVGTFLTAPKPARFLAEFGAEVIKIERTEGGPFRQSTPHAEPVDGITPLQAIVNSGKKSLALDISSEAGHEIFMTLLRDADVVIENMAPGAMDALGLGYEDVASVNEGVVYCSISGYGGTGPWSDRKAVDFMAQGMSGLSYQNALRSGADEPSLSGWFVADELTVAYVTIAVLAALIGDEGTHIDISMLDVLLGAFSDKAAAYSAGSDVAPPGAPERAEGPRGIYHTATDPLTVDVLPRTLERWRTFWEILGFDDWVESERFCTTAEIRENRDLVEKRVQKRFESAPRETWLERLWDADFVAAPVLTVEEAFEHEQLESRTVLSEETDDRIGDYLQLHFPAIFSEYDVSTSEPVASLGEHTRELLERVGYSEREIDEFYENGVVA